MEYEQKYKEAQGWIEKIYPTLQHEQQMEAEAIFPELKESGDEKIRDEIILYIGAKDDISLDTHNKWLSWLEKQVEQDNNEDLNILQRFSFYSYKDEPQVLYLSNVFVNEKYRNKGIGTKILKIANEVSTYLKCNSIRLKTENGSNAESLYRKNGYKTLTEEGNQIWLEKQGEQKPQGKSALEAAKEEKVDNRNYIKPADKVEPKFKVGDWILINVPCKVKGIDKYGNYIVEYIDSDNKETHVLSKNYCESYFHLWTIDDAKDGDIICVKNAPFIYKHHDSRYIYTYCTLNFEGEFLSLTPLCWDIVTYYGEIFPATKEQRDTLFAKMKESGYKWNDEKKELEKIEDEEYNGEDYGIDGLWHAMNILEKTLGKVSGYQTDDGFLSHQCAITSVKKLYKQKPTWSEEDERNLNDAILFIETGTYSLDKDNLINWLKSLRPQNTWKPSKEQIVVLELASKYERVFTPKQIAILIDLKEQLKNLKGE